MPLSIIDEYLNELEIQEIERLYIEEGLRDISFSKMKSDVEKNTDKLYSIAKDVGIDIKKITQQDFLAVGKIIRSEFENEQNIRKTSINIFKYIIEILKRVWTPATVGEKITSGVLFFVLGVTLLVVIHGFLTRVTFGLLLKFKTGPKAVITFILKNILSPITEEFFKRFMIKKVGKKGGIISAAAFGVVEWFFRLKKLLTQGKFEVIKDLVSRIIFHTYTAVAQAGGMKLDELIGDDKRTFEYAAFIFAVVVHSLMNITYLVKTNLGGVGNLVALWKGDASFVADTG
jgi:hypothetical protein